MKQLWNRYGLSLLAFGLCFLPMVAHAQSSTNPQTILQAVLTLILGPVGILIATLAFIGALCMVGRIGLIGIVTFVVILAFIFGSSYVVQQFVGSGG